MACEYIIAVEASQPTNPIELQPTLNLSFSPDLVSLEQEFDNHAAAHQYTLLLSELACIVRNFFDLKTIY